MLRAQGDLATLRAGRAFRRAEAPSARIAGSAAAEFEVAGARVLEKAQEASCPRAEARFSQSEEKQAERISTVLAPVGARLKAYEEQVAALEQGRVDAFGQLTGLIQSIRDGQEKVREEAARLGNALPMLPRRVGAGANRRCVTYWNNAVFPNIPISSPNIRSTPRKGVCVPTLSFRYRGKRNW
jgi:DNA recombination protein RmuC